MRSLPKRQVVFPLGAAGRGAADLPRPRPRGLETGYKALLLALLLLAGLLLAGLVAADRRGRLSREKLAQWWHRRLLAVLNVKVQIAGPAPSGSGLLVANHVSWLDIHVIGALTPTRFISKSEVRHWPVAGQLADACGTFYLRRGKGGSGPLLEQLVPHLRRGGSVTLFPEGTTTAGHSVKPFHARLFAAAIDSGCRVQPVALCYRPGENGQPVAPFIGDDDLLSHVLRMLREPVIEVDVVLCPALSPVDADRDELARAAECSVRRIVEAAKLDARCCGEVAAEPAPA